MPLQSIGEGEEKKYGTQAAWVVGSIDVRPEKPQASGHDVRPEKPRVGDPWPGVRVGGGT